MRWLLWVIALAALAVGSVLVARVNQGFVLLVTPVYRVELSLNLAIVILVAAIIAGYLLVRTLAVAVSMPARVREFNKRRAEKKARQAFGDAYAIAATTAASRSSIMRPTATQTAASQVDGALGSNCVCWRDRA